MSAGAAPPGERALFDAAPFLASVDSEEQLTDLATLREVIRLLRRENAHWRIRYKLVRLQREELEARLANRQPENSQEMT